MSLSLFYSNLLFNVQPSILYLIITFFSRQALDQLESEVQERINRWSRIEALTGHLIRSDIHNQCAKSTICETTSSIPCSIDKYRYCNGSMKSSDSDRLSSMIEETSLESNRFPKSTGNGLVNDFDCTHNKESKS